MNSSQALDVALTLGASTVLDIGSGSGEHADCFRANGHKVITVDLGNADVCGDFNYITLPKVDLVWCSHVLEHQLNPNDFLVKCFELINDDGWFCVTVPPLKHEIVGGHVNLYNAGLLLYQMIVAGFDCSQAMVKSYGYNISVIVQKKAANLPSLKMDFGDIETLSPFFPMPVINGFNGQIEEINWPN